MARREASCSGVMVTSGKDGMMKGEASPCTGTDSAACSTLENCCRSDAVNLSTHHHTMTPTSSPHLNTTP